MKPGDWIRQRHQANAPERLVCGFAPSGLLVVWNEREGYRWVHRWSHDLVREGTTTDRMRAEDQMRLKNLRCEQHLRWIFGDQVRK